jgi:hypothetical protein
LTDWFSVLLAWVLRIGLVLAGLVFAMTMLVLAGMLLALWLLRALWAKLTGRPVAAWDFQMHRQANWQRFYRNKAEADTGPPAQPTAPRPSSGDDVTDVRIKRLDEPDHKS